MAHGHTLMFLKTCADPSECSCEAEALEVKMINKVSTCSTSNDSQVDSSSALIHDIRVTI